MLWRGLPVLSLLCSSAQCRSPKSCERVSCALRGICFYHSIQIRDTLVQAAVADTFQSCKRKPLGNTMSLFVLILASFIGIFVGHSAAHSAQNLHSVIQTGSHSGAHTGCGQSHPSMRKYLNSFFPSEVPQDYGRAHSSNDEQASRGTYASPFRSTQGFAPRNSSSASQQARRMQSTSYISVHESTDVVDLRTKVRLDCFVEVAGCAPIRTCRSRAYCCKH